MLSASEDALKQWTRAERGCERADGVVVCGGCDDGRGRRGALETRGGKGSAQGWGATLKKWPLAQILRLRAHDRSDVQKQCEQREGCRGGCRRVNGCN